MKAFQSAIVLLIICVSCGEALKCYSCTRSGCTTTVETCWRENDVCATIDCPAPSNIYVKRCMKRSDEAHYRDLLDCSVETCDNKDRCNSGR